METGLDLSDSHHHLYPHLLKYILSVDWLYVIVLKIHTVKLHQSLFYCIAFIKYQHCLSFGDKTVNLEIHVGHGMIFSFCIFLEVTLN